MVEHDIMDAINKLSFELMYYRERTIRNENLSFTSLFVLKYIHMHGGCNLSEISEVLGLSKSTITHIIDNLEEKNYLKREYDPDDRRIIRIKLGEIAIIFLEKQNKMFMKVRNELSNLSEDKIKYVTETIELISKIVSEEYNKGE